MSDSTSNPAPTYNPGDPRDVISSQRFEFTHVLFVDPEVAYLKLIEMAFKRRGHKVTAVSTAQQAIEVLGREPVDLMVMELHFPDGGGYGLLEHAREKPVLRRMPVMVLTKDRKARSKVRALEIGADDVLNKPCLLEELFVRIENTVRIRRELFLAAHDVRGDLAGKLRSLPMQDLFPLLQQGRRTGLLRLGDSGQELARVWWSNGEVIAAEFGPLAGEEAVYALFPLRSGNFEFHNNQLLSGIPNVTSNVTSLLLEGLRRLDETVTFQIIGGRPQAGPRGAHIEWFSNAVELARTSSGTTLIRRRRTDSQRAASLHDAMGRLPADLNGSTLHFADLREIRELSAETTAESACIVLACELEEGVRLMGLLAGGFSPAELRRGLRSGVELFPTARVPLEHGQLRLIVAPPNEAAVLSRSVPHADGFYVAPPGGRWIVPELREGFKNLLLHARPPVCLPVGDGTVVEGLTALLREAALDSRMAPVVEKLPAGRAEFVQLLQSLLRELAAAPASGDPRP